MNQTRDHWGSRIGFVLAAAGSAIGLGNLWKFPYITFENNGGAFVLVYLACIAMVGLPIMITEILIGRKTQLSAVGAMQSLGPWGWVGGLGVLTGFVILGYYTVIAGWSLRYFTTCVGWTMSGYTTGDSGPDAFAAFTARGSLQVLLSGLFMLATMTVVLKGVGRGIEAVARVLLPILFAILLVLLGSAMTMEGAGKALSFIFEPRFDELPMSGVLEALGHAFFTLSLGMGAMITYGSYMRRSESVVRSALMVVVLDTLIALVATVTMFSVVFSVPGLSDSIGRSAVGMLFITLPEQFYTVVPFGGILAPLFYVLVAFAALTSTISLLEVIVAYFIDQRGMPRNGAVILVGFLTLGLSTLCALSLGAVDGLSSFSWIAGKEGVLSQLDHLASNWFLPLGGFFITLVAGWFVSRDELRAELVDATTPGWFNFEVWRFFVRF
ncbi:MAG: sodium-dependent transporter, partial [Candidatus Latescibacterota bacterium]